MKEYLLMGSDSKWYLNANTIGEVIEEAARLREKHKDPEVLYVFKAEEINRIYKNN